LKYGQIGKLNVEAENTAVNKESESSPKTTTDTGFNKKDLTRNTKDEEFSSTGEANVQKVEDTKMLVERLPDENSSRGNVTNKFTCRLRTPGANTKTAHQSLFLPSLSSSQGVEASVDSATSGVRSGRVTALRTINPGGSSRPSSFIDTSGLVGTNQRNATGSKVTKSNNETLPHGSTSSAVDGSTELSFGDVGTSTVDLSGGESKPSSNLDRAGSQVKGTKFDSASGSAGKLRSTGGATSSLGVSSSTLRGVVPSSQLKDKEDTNSNTNSSSKGEQQQSVNTVVSQPLASASLRNQKTLAVDKAEPVVGSSVKSSETIASSKPTGASSHVSIANNTVNNTDKSAGSKRSVDQSPTSVTPQADKGNDSSTKAASGVESTLPACLPVSQDSSLESRTSTARVESASTGVRLDAGLTAKKFTASSSSDQDKPTWIEMAKQRQNRIGAAGNS